MQTDSHFHMSCAQPSSAFLPVATYLRATPFDTHTISHPHPVSALTTSPLPSGDPTSEPVARSNALSSTFVWIDCFSTQLFSPTSTNDGAPQPQPPPQQQQQEQHSEVLSALDDGDSSSTPGLRRRIPDLSDTRDQMVSVLRQCESALLLIDSGAAALSRTWCLYEVAQALVLRGPQFLHVPVFDFTLDIVYNAVKVCVRVCMCVSHYSSACQFFIPTSILHSLCQLYIPSDTSTFPGPVLCQSWQSTQRLWSPKSLT